MFGIGVVKAPRAASSVLESSRAMAVAAPDAGLRRTRKAYDRFGDRALYIVTALCAFLSVAVIAAIIWKVAEGAWPAIQEFGISFIWHSEWNPVTSVFGAWQFILGTLITSV